MLTTERRTFEARPIFSTDEPQAAKFKLERFLHAGRQAVASVVAPIAYAPLPLLAFHRAPDGALHLAAHGARVLSCALGVEHALPVLPVLHAQQHSKCCGAGEAKALPAACCSIVRRVRQIPHWFLYPTQAKLRKYTGCLSLMGEACGAACRTSAVAGPKPC